MKNHHLINFVVILFFISGCSTIKVTSDYNPAVSFSGFQSYQWIPGGPTKIGDPRVDDNTLLQSRVRKAVDNVLASKGYQKVTSGKPDFWITYHVTLDKQVKIQAINSINHYGPGWGWRYGSTYSGGYRGNDTFVYTYDQGSLIIDIVEPDSRQLIWRGSATDKVNFSHSPEQKEQKINEAVKKLLEQFPPQLQSVNHISCSDPRPEICTMDYQPVCGFDLDNNIKTYSNACTACSDKEVVKYIKNKCSE
ncbi:MAG: DUF4136 domain-containing protein [Methylococcales bacterium]|nr:DUF4136 domain-containing protein [Methylococcales bacterium]